MRSYFVAPCYGSGRLGNDGCVGSHKDSPTCRRRVLRLIASFGYRHGDLVEDVEGLRRLHLVQALIDALLF